MKTPLFIGMSLLTLAGCASAPQPVALAPAQIETPGDYTHVASGFRFPAELADFRRVSLVQRDSVGRSVTAGYAGGSPRCLTAITFWIDPIESPPATGEAPELLQMADGKRLDEAFSHATREVLDAHASAMLESTESGVLDEMPGRRALYRVDDRRLEIVVLVAKHAWYLKYRVMFPANCAEEASPRITEFFNAWRR